MGVDHSVDLVIGYVLPLSDFFKKLLKHRPQKSHKEDRFDPKSGKIVVNRALCECEVANGPSLGDQACAAQMAAMDQ